MPPFAGIVEAQFVPGVDMRQSRAGSNDETRRHNVHPWTSSVLVAYSRVIDLSRWCRLDTDYAVELPAQDPTLNRRVSRSQRDQLSR